MACKTASSASARLRSEKELAINCFFSLRAKANQTPFLFSENIDVNNIHNLIGRSVWLGG